MSGNRIFRGPTEKQPQTVNLPVAGAYLPGVLVEETATELSLITTAVGKNPLILSNADFAGQSVVTAYADEDTGVAYQPEPGLIFQCAMAAATYAKGAPLTIGASGHLTAATAASVVVAFADEAGTFTAGALADVKWANAYVAA